MKHASLHVVFKLQIKWIFVCLFETEVCYVAQASLHPKIPCGLCLFVYCQAAEGGGHQDVRLELDCTRFFWVFFVRM